MMKGKGAARAFENRRVQNMNMVRPICKDVFFLGMKAEKATVKDVPIANDLLETLKAHESECVGMAANMIGENKRIIAVNDEGNYRLMLNPEIVRKEGPYEAEEGCLSLTGTRKTQRFETIVVRYQTVTFKKQEKRFTGWTAQIIQHEVDHCEGIII